MKKIFNIFLIVLFLFVMVSCNEEEGNNENKNGEMGNIINIYTLNDFHGAIFENKTNNEIGISKIGNFLINEKKENPNNTVILSAGDMFQGTAVSSMTRGEVVVDLMNYIGFDAMALGNHEFDWGVDEIIRYVDNDEENGEAEFPFLGANIKHLPTNEYVDWAKPYTVIERGEIKIGILGLIGEGLTSSILGSISKDYEFTSELEAIKKYVPILRNQEGADIVIVASHADTKPINYAIKNLTGDQYVDAVVNGHTHYYYAFEEIRDSGAPMVVVQSGSNGKFVGHIALEVDLENKQVIDANVGFVSQDKLNTTSSEIDNLIGKYQEYIDIENEVIGQAGTYINQTIGTRWAVNTIGKFDNVDVGIINAGGIRSAGFPISLGSDVTYGSIFKMMPFENVVITLYLKGSDLAYIATYPGDLRFSSNFDTVGMTINGEALDHSKYYKIAIIDYAYYRSENTFSRGHTITHHDVIFRDLLVEGVRESVESSGKWYIK